jgi:hypothetical protein
MYPAAALSATRDQRAPSRPRESGQALVLTVLLLTVLLGVAAYVVDLGNGYYGKRRAQAAADASALAAAASLPNTAAAQTASAAFASKNFSSGSVSVTFTQSLAANDTADTHATATVPTFFASVFGIKSLAVGATASARIGSYRGWAVGLAPWVTDKQSIRWGQVINFKVAPGNQASSGNFGGVDLPVQEGSCGYSNGQSGYSSLITTATHSCMVTIGGPLPVEPGNMGSNTGKALQQRGAQKNFDPYTLLQQDSSGNYTLKVLTHPNLVVIPIIQAFHPGNSTPFTVTGFAWFIITNYSTDTVTGMFVRSSTDGGALCPTASDSKNPCPVGAYDPDGITVVQLIK